MTPAQQDAIKRFRERFFQDKTGERCENWLAKKTGQLIPHDPREFCKIATPEDIESFLLQELATARKEVIEEIRAMKWSSKEKFLTSWQIEDDKEIDHLLSSLQNQSQTKEPLPSKEATTQQERK